MSELHRHIAEKKTETAEEVGEGPLPELSAWQSCPGRMALRLHGGVGVLLTPDSDAHRAGH